MKYDVYGSGFEVDKIFFWLIGINCNYDVYILQICNNVFVVVVGIYWLVFGVNIFNMVVLFYVNVNDMLVSYKDVDGIFNFNYMYWLSCIIVFLGDIDYDFYVDMWNSYEFEVMSVYCKIENDIDVDLVNY